LLIHYKARIPLFLKTISVQQNPRRSDFRLMSDNLTVAEAAELLGERAVAGGGEDPRSESSLLLLLSVRTVALRLASCSSRSIDSKAARFLKDDLPYITACTLFQTSRIEG
jgi:hypothetical protein